MDTHSLTLKYNSKEFDILPDMGNIFRRKAYAVWKNKVSQNLTIGQLSEELDSAGRLHLHGTIKVPKAWNYAKFNGTMRMQNMHVFTTPIKTAGDLGRWIDYTQKDQPVEDNFIPDEKWKQNEVQEVTKLLKPLKLDVIFGI